MFNPGILVLPTLVLLLTACAGAPTPPTDIVPTPEPTPTQPPADATLAAVTALTVSGAPDAYTFSVTIASPDTGCDQYADWWEVVSEDGVLLYRRILTHSHAGEQPFTRSGGPVKIDPETTVWVRAHLAPGGFGGVAFHGSVAAGFAPDRPPVGFGLGLEDAPPQPSGCAF